MKLYSLAHRSPPTVQPCSQQAMDWYRSKILELGPPVVEEAEIPWISTVWLAASGYRRQNQELIVPEPHHSAPPTMGVVPWDWSHPDPTGMHTSLKNMGHFPQLRQYHFTKILEVPVVQERENKNLCYSIYWETKERPLLITLLNC